jgi:ribonuclease HI
VDEIAPPSPDYIVATGSSCLGNPGMGAWVALLVSHQTGTERELANRVLNTTNNRMELVVVIKAIERLPADRRVTLFTSSKYVVDNLRDRLDGWRAGGWLKASGEPISNLEHWKRLDAASSRLTLEIIYSPTLGFAMVRCAEAYPNLFGAPALRPGRLWHSGEDRPQVYRHGRPIVQVLRASALDRRWHRYSKHNVAVPCSSRTA